MDHGRGHLDRPFDDAGQLDWIEAVKTQILILLAVTALAATPGKQTFTGVVTDSMCPRGNHKEMQMGPTDAECTLACIREHAAQFVLFDGMHAYTLSDQKTPEKFAGQKVTVTGTLDAKSYTIKVDSIVAAK